MNFNIFDDIIFFSFKFTLKKKFSIIIINERYLYQFPFDVLRFFNDLILFSENYLL